MLGSKLWYSKTVKSNVKGTMMMEFIKAFWSFSSSLRVVSNCHGGYDKKLGQSFS